RQPKRKLGAEDRLVKPALLTRNQGRIPAYLATGIAAALHYDHADDVQAQELVSEIRHKGLARVLHEVSGLAPHDELTRLVQSDFLLRAL
ncbi:MAG: mannitol-1-phosphate 5-dehydrogenase, partial [Patescibacteria group bacterium]